MLRGVALAMAALLATAACERREAPAPAPAPAESRGEAVFRLAEDYFEESLALNPLRATFIGDERYNDRLAIDIAPEHIGQIRALEQRYLEAAEAIDPDALDAESRLTWDVFTIGRSEALEALEFPFHLLPLNQMAAIPQAMAMLGSGQGPQPFRDAEDYRKFMSRMDDFARWADQAIDNMRAGIERDIVQPRVVIEKMIPQYDALLNENPERTLFWAPVANFPDAVDAGERARLTDAWRERLSGTLLPAYARLRDFLRDEYLPAGRESVGWTALPDGEAWYALNVRHQTTTDMTPDEIHRLGLSEVARIRAEMDRIRVEVGFEGDLAAFFAHLKSDPRYFFDSPDEVLEAYGELKQRINAALPALFADFPQADYELRAIEAFRAESAAGAEYQQPSADGARPGIFYVNTFNLKAQPRYGTETLSLHEASPGHHFQIAIQQEIEQLPRLRRFGGETAFVEGWALYAESLGPDLGLFKDPYAYYGRLNDEQLRAMRLVVDTGLHAFGWSREDAIAFMLENSSMAETDVIAEVERYIVWPGQALGYKIGELTISGLRRDAERELGERFDLKDWHGMVLRGGSMPMNVLTARTQRWIEARRAAN
ncbi:MAG TPA: DUF885 domain-containing protein [Gammaproteobacteria bacterium]|nr:DUF885 domain-containing protein [Gammaproteobacteria bacterium]